MKHGRVHPKTGWAQSALLPPEHLRIELTIHLGSTSHTAQVGCHVSDHVTGQELAIWTEGLDFAGDRAALVRWAALALGQAIEEHYYPF